MAPRTALRTPLVPEAVLAGIESVVRHRGSRPIAGSGPLVSVIVPTLNAVETLPATLDSLAAQTWPAVEVIVVDGGSTDGTRELLEQRAGDLSLWISAPDHGIADAFNRGIALSRGEVVQITNAGDRLPPGHLARAVRTLEAHPDAGFVYGDVRMVDGSGRVTRLARGRPLVSARSFDSMAVAPHPAMAVRRTAYKRIGLYDGRWSLTMDFDWLTRAVRAGIEGVYDPGLVADMAEGGASNAQAMRRDWENFQLTLQHRTMSPPLAAARLGLKAVMNLSRGALEGLGRERESYALRRGIDRLLGRG